MHLFIEIYFDLTVSVSVSVLRLNLLPYSLYPH